MRVDLSLGTGLGGDAQGDILASIENVIGSRYSDRLVGNSSDNGLTGGVGADVLIGGSGSDTAIYDASTAAIRADLRAGVGTGGDAQGDTYSSIENAIGSAYDDLFIGTTGANRFEGGDGADYLSGREGADTLIGGNGSDTASYRASAAGVTVNLTAGTASGGDAAGDVLSAIENLTGSAYADTLIGDSLANRLAGGEGKDVLTGNAGADTFVFDTAVNSSNVDTVSDFKVGTDVIELSQSIYTALQSGPKTGSLAASSFRFSTQPSTSGTLGEMIYNASTGSLSYDSDGAGSNPAKQVAQLSSNLNLSASAFRLV